MAQIKILVEGVHDHTPDNLINIASTTTLIKSNINVVVDPGAFVNKDNLLKALAEEGLAPENIDAVILTHLHLDHTLNTFLFPGAKVYLRFICSNYGGQYQDIEKGQLHRFDILKELIADDVEIVETPGHSIDSISILVKTEQGLVAIVGDAIARQEWANLEKEPQRDLAHDVEKYKESRKKLLQIADYIVPGHDKMFKVEK